MHTVIVVDEAALLRVITQPDHARFAGDLLALWRSDGLPEHPRRDQLLFAVREHDNGWREVDAAPRVDSRTQRLYEFSDYPEPARLEIWDRGIQRFADQHPYAAVLIAKHAETLHQPLDAGWQALFGRLDSSRQEWLEKAGVEAGELAEDYRYLQLADTLSLACCSQRNELLRNLPMTARVDGNVLRLEPFPLAGATTFQIPVRRIPNRPLATDSAAGSALARARWDRLAVKVAPL